MTNKYLEKIAGNYILDKDGKPDVLKNAVSSGVAGAALGVAGSAMLDRELHSARVNRVAGNVGTSTARVLGNAFKPKILSKKNLKSAGKFGVFLGGLSAASSAAVRGVPTYSEK